jgi:hypothetical protein
MARQATAISPGTMRSKAPEALTEPSASSDIDTVLVMLAVTGGTPASSSAG